MNSDNWESISIEEEYPKTYEQKPIDKITEIHYTGKPVTFRESDNGLMVRATDMGNIFKKPITRWLSLAETKKYLNAYGKLNIESKAGNLGYTWLPSGIAQEYAHWLSPLFAKWMMVSIDSFNHKGVKTDNEKPKNTKLFKELASKEAEIQELKKLIERRDDTIQILHREFNDFRADSIFAQVILSHGKRMSIGEFADLITLEGEKLNAETFIQWLSDHLYYDEDNFGIKTEYIKQGLFVLDVKSFCDKEGTYHKLQTPYLTPKGQRHFINIFYDDGRKHPRVTDSQTEPKEESNGDNDNIG